MGENRFLSWLRDVFEYMLYDDNKDIGRLDRLHHWQYGALGKFFVELAQVYIDVKDLTKTAKGENI